MNINADSVENMIAATQNKSLVWTNMEGVGCCNCVFNGTKFIICKYEFDGANNEVIVEVALNQLNSDGFIIKPYQEYQSPHPLFKRLLVLANLAWEKREVLADSY